MPTLHEHLGQNKFPSRQKKKVLLVRKHLCQSELTICSAPMPRTHNINDLQEQFVS